MGLTKKEKEALERLTLVEALSEIEDTVDGAFGEINAGRASFNRLKEHIADIANTLRSVFGELNMPCSLEEYEQWGLTADEEE